MVIISFTGACVSDFGASFTGASRGIILGVLGVTLNCVCGSGESRILRVWLVWVPVLLGYRGNMGTYSPVW